MGSVKPSDSFGGLQLVDCFFLQGLQNRMKSDMWLAKSIKREDSKFNNQTMKKA